MFNITEVVRTLRDAETVASSRLLNADEKRLLLSQLTATGAASPLQSAKMVIDAINRERPNHGTDKRPTTVTPKEQGRKAKGLQEPTKVVAQGAKAEAETPSGPTEGGEGKAEDAGGVGRTGGDTGAPRVTEDTTSESEDRKA